MKIITEICCGSFYDAKMAQLGGAKRIELNSSLHLGGITPSLGSLILSKKQTDLKVICMVRPRGAGFLYLEEDMETMFLDAELLMQNGADGIAFGFLTKDNEIDMVSTKKMVDIITKYNGEVVFHRAFDCVNDPIKSCEELISLGIHRILTSGLEDKAINGTPVLANLQTQFGDKVEFLMGSGVNATNTKTLVSLTGINQVHSSCKEWLEDSTTSANGVSYSYFNGTNNYDVVSKELSEKLVNACEELVK